jgi:hypothetical protein
MQSGRQWMCLGVSGALALTGCAELTRSDGGEMSFFITSAGLGDGGNLGGIEGADRHCQALAAAAGAGGRTWHAYLSTQGGPLNDPNVVHARDRIGSGPWFNAKGARIARDVEDLHSDHNNVTKETGLDERGRAVNGRKDKPSKHDILTGSRPDGTAFPPSGRFADMTCRNWTLNTAQGAAMTGHFDRGGAINHSWAMSWNSSHPTLDCSQAGILKTGGDGLLYCFASK